MTEILTILISILSSVSVRNTSNNVNMLAFDGHAESAYFVGDVLPCGVDTQFGDSTGVQLSARYMLEGTDRDGQKCHIFIENNAVTGEEYTSPKIVTDSKTLAFLNTAKLKGKLDNVDGKLVIRVYRCE